MDVAPRIQRLPDDLINQIAAGEVVERPSSIIKELVENSLDAGSTRIDILLKDGGIQEISIVDNGVGIPESDLPLAVERHATSKVRTFSDLTQISSFGFRGEALASIASVSELELTSRTAEMSKAACLRVSYSQLSTPLTYQASPPGTRVTMQRLFDRVPARLKFLRSPGTEFSHCAKVVREVALGNPEIAFFLHHQGKLVHSYAPGDRRSRFQDCFKPPWEPLHFSESTEEIAVEGFLSPPQWVADRGELLLYINGRPIRHKTLTSAVRNAYQKTFGPHHEPSGVLYLDIQKDWVDVNVHPQKWEVRLLRQESVYAWLLTQVRRLLERFSRENKLFPTDTAPFPSLGEGKSFYQPSGTSPFSNGTLSLAGQTPSRYRYLGSLRNEYWVVEEP